MANITTKIVFHLFILAIAVTMSTCRPQNPIDSQDVPEYQPNLSDIRSYYSYPSQAVFENAPLERLQMLIGQGKPASGSWDNLYRIPESKRQVRYRQCYFNPISCFKK